LNIEDFFKIEGEERNLGMVIFSVPLESLKIDEGRRVVKLDSDHEIGYFPEVLLAF
jgi:hypothetical protein